MKLRFSSLTLKQTFLVSITVFCFAVALLFIEFISVVHTEKRHLKQQGETLIHTLEQSAKASSLNDNTLLAQQLLKQSFDLPWIQSVSIELRETGRIFSANKPLDAETGIWHDLAQWLFQNQQHSTRLLYRDNSQPFARLNLHYDLKKISQTLQRHFTRTFIFSLIGTLVLTVLLTCVFHLFLTKPMLILSQAIDKITPDTPKDNLLPRIPFHNNNELSRVLTKFNQILIQFDMAQLKLRKMATKDPLTSLPNRVLLLETINLSIQRSSQQKRSFALFYIDLDRFKNINDSLGHQLGDRYLLRIARVLKRVVGEKGTVARLGGDEFAIIANDPQTLPQAGEFAQTLIKEIKKPLFLNEHKLHPNASVGIALYPDDGHNADDLIRHAEIAMYSAKKQGLGNWAFFNKKMTEKAIAHLRIEANLYNAIRNDNLSLFFQPKIELATGKMKGAEALIRWHQGDKVISPGEFIPVAEESGLIVTLGKWVINKTCETLRKWCDEFNQVPSIAINIAAKHFIDPKFVEQLKSCVSSFHLDPSLIEIEITESSFIHDIQLAIAVIEQLRKSGFKVSIDDFGTGYSSLSYLKVLPINTLKIDRAFVEGLPENDAIASTIVMLGQQMDLEIVAEGIDEAKQLKWLQAHGCALGQGYLFSRPLPQEEFENQYLEPEQTVLEIE
ncbi:EAL domain-containing protein [Parashewanella curva]|uniref:EAL domain-containing protein n=1 Tax=Parashewanella curva TaxID=2338552 RepID=A0A3L8Q0Y8_9GAMM|nr:EAL domain-containing protein [Parashewanella curva]RLV61301.1 EAL domain-containing protein [Parashewanella curva]